MAELDFVTMAGYEYDNSVQLVVKNWGIRVISEMGANPQKVMG